MRRCRCAAAAARCADAAAAAALRRCRCAAVPLPLPLLPLPLRRCAAGCCSTAADAPMRPARPLRSGASLPLCRSFAPCATAAAAHY
jgi:hypothetical protein